MFKLKILFHCNWERRRKTNCCIFVENRFFQRWRQKNSENASKRKTKAWNWIFSWFCFAKKKPFSFQWFDLLKTCCDLFSIDRLNLKISVFYYFSFQTFVMLFSDGNIFQLVLTRTFFVLMQITKRIWEDLPWTLLFHSVDLVLPSQK